MRYYAAVYPETGCMEILCVTTKEIVKHYISTAKEGYDHDFINQMFADVKEAIDERIKSTGICICISSISEEYRNSLIKLAEYNGLQNVEVVADFKAISYEAILQTNNSLKNGQIIWTYLNNQCCIWDGKICKKMKYDNVESFEALLITTVFPPDIIICDIQSSSQVDQSFVNQIYPECKISQFELKREKSAALTYAEGMETMLLKDDSNDKIIPKNIFAQNNRLPKTDIYVGISDLINNVTAQYSFVGMQKEFSFTMDLSSLEKRIVMEQKLKLAAARLNGILRCICIVSDSNLDQHIIYINWAVKKCGFEKAEVISKGKADYIKVMSELPSIKNSDVVWISISFEYYEIWQDYTHQKTVQIKELEKALPEKKYFPNFVIFTDRSWEMYKGPILKKYFPECKYLLHNCQHTYKTLLKYAQMLATDDFSHNKLLNADTVESNSNTLNSNKSNQNPEVQIESKKPVEKNRTSTPKTLNPEKVIINDYVEETKTSPVESLKLREVVDNDHVNDKNVYTFPKQTSINNEKIKIVGIDLGTSRCCAAVNRKNYIGTVHLDNTGERLLPSYVAYDEENVKCGKVVVNRLRQYSKSTVFDSKRIIGRNIGDIEIDSNWPFRISIENDKVVLELKKCNVTVQKSAEEVATDLLKFMKKKAEDYQGAKLSKVVITVPAAFTKNQKEATLRAAKNANWENIELLLEPVAASFAYFMDQPTLENVNVLVFDLGGGTLDVCLFKIKNDKLFIISNTGDTKLGGRDFDTVVFNFFKNKLNGQYGISLPKDKKYKLILECQQIKEDLSTVESCHLNIDEYDTTQEGSIVISREEFESMTKPLQNRIRNTLNSALLTSKQNPNQIEKILLVGGGSRMPMIKNLLREMFPDAEQCVHENPDEVVAIGAAYFAYSIYSQ